MTTTALAPGTRDRLHIVRARPLVWVSVLAALVLIARSAFMAHVHCESFDAAAQFMEGLRFWERAAGLLSPNDPPFGQGLITLPFYLMGCRSNLEPMLYAQPISIDTILLISGIWKAILFLPTVPLIFAWARRLYGEPAGWLAAGLLLIDPNFAGLIPIGTVDSLVVTAVTAAVLAWWRYFERPGLLRLVLAAALLGVAVSVKHNAAVAALCIPAFAALWWLRDWRVGVRTWLKQRFAAIMISSLVLALILWSLTLFNWSKPLTHLDRAGKAVSPISYSVPAGTYVGSFVRGLRHNEDGHWGYLFGEVRKDGWFYYFPVLLSYKMPPGMILALAGAAVSLFYRRLRWEEASLLAPLVVGMGLMLSTNINTGFRHFLPVYIFLFPAAARWLAMPDRGVLLRTRMAVAMSAACLLFTIGDCVRWFPNYVPYINFARTSAYREISDSNVDLGESLKQVATWLKQNPRGDKPAYIKYFGSRRAQIPRYLGPDVTVLKPGDPPVRSGLLIISPAHLIGFFRDSTYTHLRDVPPLATIGNTMLVFDLDRAHSHRMSGL